MRYSRTASRERGFLTEAKKIRRSDTQEPLSSLKDATSWKRRGSLIATPKLFESRVLDVRTGLGAGEFQSNEIARNYARARA